MWFETLFFWPIDLSDRFWTWLEDHGLEFLEFPTVPLVALVVGLFWWPLLLAVGLALFPILFLTPIGWLVIYLRWRKARRERDS